MSLPFISCSMVTFARVSLVEEAVECFLRQDYPGPKELVIFSDFTKQKLVYNHPEIRIINAEKRMGSLGESRNRCVEACDGEVITFFDDDNIYLKGWLSSVARSIEGVDWFQIKPYFYAEDQTILRVNRQCQACIAGRKSAWCKIGGFKHMNSGEDKQWARDLRAARLPWRRVEVSPEEINFTYRWGHFALHASGKGPDTSTFNGHERFGVWAENGVRSGMIPTGEIALRPNLKTDWEAQAEAMRQKMKAGLV